MNSQKFPDRVKFNYKIWLSTLDGQGIMGDGKWQILKAIEAHGSLKAATKALRITYRRTWGDLKAIENVLGFALLEKTRGGKDGGQTRLTLRGARMVAAFDQLHEQADAFMEQQFSNFLKKMEEPGED